MISQSQSIAIDIEKVQTIMKFEFKQTNVCKYHVDETERKNTECTQNNL